MALVPPGVVTVTLTVPVPRGDVAVTLVELVTWNLAASVPLKVTIAASVKLVPVIVTTVPPAAGPVDGVTLVTVGAGFGVVTLGGVVTFGGVGVGVGGAP